MRCKALVVAAILIGAASAPAAAQIKLDMNKITCGDWLGYAPADRDFVRYFMSGYLLICEVAELGGLFAPS